MQLLKDVLDSWKREVEKKPPLMTMEEAYKQLGLISGKHHDEAIVRKSFYKLAQMYHPDKNPEGRVSLHLELVIMIYIYFLCYMYILRIKRKLVYTGVHACMCIYIHVCILYMYNIPARIQQ